MVGQTNDQPDNDEESVPPQKKGRMTPSSEADEMAVDTQSMLDREEQAINHFNRTTDEIMVRFFDFISENLAILEMCAER